MFYNAKCIVLGSSKVGKSSIVTRIIKNKFINDENYYPTLGIDFAEKKVNIDDNNGLVLQIFDTGALERYNCLIESYFKNMNCVLFCFSLVDISTVNALVNLIPTFDNINNDINTVRILVGTHSDEDDTYYINKEVIKEIKDKFDINYYFNISSKTGENVNELISFIPNQIVINYKDTLKQSIKYFKSNSKNERSNITNNNNNNIYECCSLI